MDDFAEIIKANKVKAALMLGLPAIVVAIILAIFNPRQAGDALLAGITWEIIIFFLMLIGIQLFFRKR